MPYKDKKNLYVAQKRYRERQKAKLEEIKKKLAFYEKTYGSYIYEVV